MVQAAELQGRLGCGTASAGLKVVGRLALTRGHVVLGAETATVSIIHSLPESVPDRY